MKNLRCNTFTEEENIQLCTSWVAIPFIADKPVWQVIHTHFKTHSKTNVTRNIKQLQDRFNLMLKMFIKWQRALEAVTSNKEIHASDDIVLKICYVQHFVLIVYTFFFSFLIQIEIAQHKYCNIKLGTPVRPCYRFRHISCYEILREDKRWKAYYEKKTVCPAESRAKRRKVEPMEDEIDSDSSSDNNEDSSYHEEVNEPLTCIESKEISHSTASVVSAANATKDEIGSWQNKTELIKVEAMMKQALNEELKIELQIMTEYQGPGSDQRREEYFTILQNSIIEKRKNQNFIQK